jgi:hypothetical protein
LIFIENNLFGHENLDEMVDESGEMLERYEFKCVCSEGPMKTSLLGVIYANLPLLRI